MVSQAELILRVITLCFLVLSQLFRDGMGPFKTLPDCTVSSDLGPKMGVLGRLAKTRTSKT